MNYKIDNLQYCKWSREVFQINREAGLDAVHVTVVYHEDFDEFNSRVDEWNTYFKDNSDLIFLGKSYKDIEKAKKEKKTAIFFGFQNCSPIEDDIGLVEKVYDLGCRFMQLTYNNQSLLATGCFENVDSGVTNFGKEVIKEMNRLGLVIDMSHSAEKSTIDAINISQKPIAITHANPTFWHAAKRNKSDELLKNELSIRKKNELPPFIRLIAIIVSSKDHSLSLKGAREIKMKLSKISGLEILGPIDSPLLKVKKNFRSRLLIRFSNQTLMQKKISNVLNKLKISSKIKFPYAPSKQ